MQALGELTVCTLDWDTEQGRREAQSLNIGLLPTFILMNAEQDVYDYWIGYKDPEDWLARIAAARGDLTTLAQKQARFDKSPNLRDALTLGHEAYGKRDVTGTIRYYGTARTLDREASVAANLPYRLARAYLLGAETGVFTPAQMTEALDEIFDSADTTPEAMLQLAERIVGTARKLGDPRLAAPYLTRAMAHEQLAAAEATDPDLVRNFARVRPLHALLVENDSGRALELKQQEQGDGWRDDAHKLNSVAWFCFENGIELAKAEQLARRGIELAQDAALKAGILDTLAEILNARGDRSGALESIEQALALAPDNDYYRQQRERFSAE